MRRREDLSRPRRGRLSLGVHYDPEAFGDFSEAIARFLGTARFLVFQTVLVFVWILLNAAFDEIRWDEYPFILLTLALSLQAAYAAPLILLATVVLVFGSMSPRFHDPQNLGNILVQSSSTTIVAIGMTFVLLTAGVDLSVGATSLRFC